jgi:serine protease Do
MPLSLGGDGGWLEAFDDRQARSDGGDGGRDRAAGRGDRGARAFTAEIAVENNRVMITVRLKGRGPYLFMIDTGSYLSLIRPDLAKALKLRTLAIEQTRGIGGSAAYNVFVADDVLIGRRVHQPEVVFSDAFKFGYGADIYGALAAGMLTAMDTDLDFDASVLRFYPDGRGERPGYVAIDSEIPRHDSPSQGSAKISATVLIDGRPIRCLLDTGAPHVLMLNQAAGRRLGLWNDMRPYAPSRPNGIVGMSWQATLGAINGPAGKAVTLGIDRRGARRDVSFTLAAYL